MARYKARHAGGTYYQKSSGSSAKIDPNSDIYDYDFSADSSALKTTPKQTAKTAQKTTTTAPKQSASKTTVNKTTASKTNVNKPQAKPASQTIKPTQSVKTAQSAQTAKTAQKPAQPQRTAQKPAANAPQKTTQAQKPTVNNAQKTAQTAKAPQQRAKAAQPQHAKNPNGQHAAPKTAPSKNTKMASYQPPKQKKSSYDREPSGFALALRIIISALAGLGIVIFLVPIAKHYFTITSIIAIVFLGLLIVHVNIKRVLTDDGERGGLNVLWHVVSVVFALCICWVGFVTFQMVTVDTSEPSEDTTVVVLGAKVYQSGVSVALQNRLNTAIEYLDAHPKADVIVTGGQGDDEPWSEASAALTYLEDNGIEAVRIYTEEKSTSTYENLNNSKSILAENNLGNSIVLVTQSYHMFRASSEAKDLGYTVYCLPCKTNMLLLPTYYSREVLAITKYYITKIF